MSAIDSPFDWGAAATATGEPHAPARPTDSQIAQGYPSGQPVPAEEFNWLAYMIGQGLLPRFETLEEAVEGMSDSAGAAIEQACLVDEHDMDQAPGTAHTTTDTSDDVDSVAVTAKSIILMHDGAGTIVSRERDTTTAVATYTKTNVGNNFKVCSNGEYVALAYGAFVELFDHDTGVSQWVHNNVSTVNDICMDGTHVYVAGQLAANQVKALTIAAGALTWSYDHNANLFSIATNGRQVFVAGTASGHGSAATMRALDAATGNDAANEGGTALDTTGAAWDLAPNAIAANERLACDGRYLYAIDSGAAAHLTVRGCADGVTLTSRNIAGLANEHSIAVDQDLVLVAYDAAGVNIVGAFNKSDLSMTWNWQPAAGAINSVATDGTAVFTGYDTGGGSSIARIYRGNRPGVWRRVDPGDDYLPMRQLIVPGQ